MVAPFQRSTKLSQVRGHTTQYPHRILTLCVRAHHFSIAVTRTSKTTTVACWGQAGKRVPSSEEIRQAELEVQAILRDLRTDPVLSKLLVDPKYQAIIAELRSNPAAIAKYSGDKQVKEVLSRLMLHNVTDQVRAEFTASDVSPAELLQQLYSNPRLAQLIQKPRIREAIARLSSDPNAILEYSQDAEVLEVLGHFNKIGAIDVDVGY